MAYRTLRAALDALAKIGQLIRIEQPIDPYLEAAEIQRRVFRAGGPAIYFARVKGCAFPMVCNLFGTMERVRFLFRDAIQTVQRMATLKIDPADLLRQPRLYLDAPLGTWHSRPRRMGSGPVLAHQTTIDQLPPLVSWPGDGGPYVTLPQVYTEDPDRPGMEFSNLGMYRVQLAGNRYKPNRQVGLHYQIHRGIGAHHAAAIRRGEKLRVNVFVGGAPAMTVAAVMPMPEGVSELAFAGILGRHRIPMIVKPGQLPMYAEADFCISGTIDPKQVLPEGPFGDHLGYYSLAHDFPVLEVDSVYHRDDAVWPFTVVGRPPQEDTLFAQLIQELVGPVIPRTIPGMHAVHAVDAAGVHPLLLAIGSERYVPYEDPRRPRELLTLANALLGHGQISLAKYLLIVAREDAPALDIHDVAAFFDHVLRRVDWMRDLHFQTRTTIDTLDYSGTQLHEGSKVVVAAAGPARRDLPKEIPASLHFPGEGAFHSPRVALPGALVVQGPAYRQEPGRRDSAVAEFCAALSDDAPLNGFPLVVVADDSEFAARTLDNFLWTTFTRSNPADDIYGVGSSTDQKHWGCRGSLVIDARTKPHHAPPLVEDTEVTRRVDALGAKGGPLAGIIA